MDNQVIPPSWSSPAGHTGLTGRGPCAPQRGAQSWVQLFTIAEFTGAILRSPAADVCAAKRHLPGRSKRLSMHSAERCDRDGNRKLSAPAAVLRNLISFPQTVRLDEVFQACVASAKCAWQFWLALWWRFRILLASAAATHNNRGHRRVRDLFRGRPISSRHSRQPFAAGRHNPAG